MDLSTLANVVNAVAVTAGVLFAVVQLRDYRHHRRHEGMLNLVRSFENPTFSKALRRVIELPDNVTADQIRQLLGSEGEDVIVHVTATWEAIGILVFHEELTLDIVDDFFSGPILISWRKLLPYTSYLREHYERETWSEWFQWLAERMMERESKVAAVPAYLAHRNWKKAAE